jgi:DNA-binding transcriptional LysR family regulator
MGMTDDSSDDRLAIAFVSGVTLTKWTRAWAERRPDVPLTVTEIIEAEQVAVLHDGSAQLSFVRLPIDTDGLHVIPLYREVAVAVAAKDHAIAAADSLTLADLANFADPEGETVRTGSGFGPNDFDLVAAGVGILVVPHSIARLQSRKDLVSRPVTDAAETQIALAWRADPGSDLLASRIEEFVGIVRGRTAHSSRSTPLDEASAKPNVAKAKQSTSQSKAKRPAPSRGGNFAQQRKNAAARKKHRPH